MMRIVQVIESTATGTLAMARLISNWFSAAGHDVHVIYSMREDTPADIKEQFHPSIQMHLIQMSGQPLLRIIGQLRSKLTAIQPDVVHLHSSYAGFLGRLASIGTLSDTKFFYSPHCISFMRKDISKLKKWCFIGLEKLASIKPCMYIACSESEKNEIEKHLGAAVLLIENAVDGKMLSKIHHTDVNAKAKQQSSVVTVGGIRKQKNPTLFAEMAKAFRGNGVEFIWVGDGDCTFKNQLLEAGVTVSGWMSREQVVNQLSNATIYLSTALWEGMPVSVIEAMGCGLPVVASKCAGNVDIIQHGRTGLLFSDVSDGVAAIQDLLDAEELAQSLSENALADIKKRFSESRFFAELSAAYGC